MQHQNFQVSMTSFGKTGLIYSISPGHSDYAITLNNTFMDPDSIAILEIASQFHVFSIETKYVEMPDQILFSHLRVLRCRLNELNIPCNILAYGKVHYEQEGEMFMDKGFRMFVLDNHQKPLYICHRDNNTVIEEDLLVKAGSMAQQKRLERTIELGLTETMNFIAKSEGVANGMD